MGQSTPCPPQGLSAKRIKALKKMALPVVQMLPSNREEAYFVLGVATIHVDYLDGGKLVREEMGEAGLEARVLEFTRRFRSA